MTFSDLLTASGAPTDRPAVSISSGYPGPGSIADAILTARATSGQLPYLRSASVPYNGISWSQYTAGLTAAGFACQVDYVPSVELANGLHDVTFPGGERCASVATTYEPSWGGWQVTVAGSDADVADTALAAVLDLLPVPDREGASGPPEVVFWMATMHGPVRRSRPITDAQPWEAVAGNYPNAIRGHLEALAHLDGPPAGGKLALFHGPPGTGKTRYLYTLAHEWRDWCQLHYVHDTDRMFGDGAYLAQVLMDAERDDLWRCILIEDGDEYVDAHQKPMVGNGISRLLNTADGFIGQGLKVMVLVSTNVKDINFSPATIRPGRCFANIKFPEFEVDEALEWLAANGVEQPENTPLPKKPTLAALYDATAKVELSTGDSE